MRLVTWFGLLLAFASAQTAAPARPPGCEPREGVQFICGFAGPEDEDGFSRWTHGPQLLRNRRELVDLVGVHQPVAQQRALDLQNARRTGEVLELADRLLELAEHESDRRRPLQRMAVADVDQGVVEDDATPGPLTSSCLAQMKHPRCLLATHQAQVAQQLSRFTSLVNEMATILSASAIVG